MTRKPKSLAIQKSKEERLLDTFEHLARFRQIERKTIEECSALLSLSQRAIYNYLNDERYKEVVDRLRAEWREAGITKMGTMVNTALDTLLDVMQTDKSGHARFEAASKVLELFGVQVLPEQRETQDDTAELQRMAELLAARPVTVNIFQQPEPGGYLPKALQTNVVDSEFVGAHEKLKQLAKPEEPATDPFQEWVDGLSR